MTIAHHPDEELLAAYAAGALDLGQRVAIATHLAACESCRGWVRAMEQVGGALISDMAPAALAEGALDRTLARIDEPAPPAPGARRVRKTRLRTCRASSRPMNSALGGAIAPRIAMRPIRLPEPGPTRVFLLKAGPGNESDRACPYRGRDDLRPHRRFPARRRTLWPGRFRLRRHRCPSPAANRGGRRLRVARRHRGRTALAGSRWGG